jgi:hypothetical protein
MELGQSLRTTGQVVKKVGTDTVNAAVLGAVIGGTISLVIVLRRVWLGQPVNGTAQRIKRV